ncbi:hypothetical protein J6590_012670 [Homalodisca vitripennis]|nr:hypothetical protein J6590_012670 [Homalodisca vitripennis]
MFIVSLSGDNHHEGEKRRSCKVCVRCGLGVHAECLVKHWLFERGRVMIIPPSVTNLNMGEFFSFSVKIVYRPPNPTPPTPLTTTS